MSESSVNVMPKDFATSAFALSKSNDWRVSDS